MRHAIRLALALTCTLTLSGCSISLGPVAERETTWAVMGTPARIVDERKLEILVPDGKGGWQRSTGVLKGQMSLDEPTLEYYRQLHEKTKGGAVKKTTDL
jgi:hypothetical protein